MKRGRESQLFILKLVSLIQESVLVCLLVTLSGVGKYSKTCIKRPLKNRQNKDLNDKW